MANIQCLPAEVLSIILDALIPVHWNTRWYNNEIWYGGKWLDKRLVCRVFDAVLSGHAFRKLDFDDAGWLQTKFETTTWLLYQKIRLEKDDDCPLDHTQKAAPTDNFKLPASCNGSFHAYFRTACKAAVAYQSSPNICNQLGDLRQIPLRKQFLRNNLTVAAYDGDESLVRSLVADGHKVNMWDGLLGSPIYAAVFANNEAVVRFLIQCKADPTVCGYLGDLLFTAVRHKNDSLVRLLLQYDAVDPNQSLNWGKTPLWYSCYVGNLAIVRLLLDHPRIDPSLKYKDQTALAAAAERGHTKIVQWLLERNDVTPNDHNRKEDYALWQAARNGNRNVVDCLLPRVDPNVEYQWDRTTPLWIAAHNGDEKIVRSLLGFEKVNPNCHGGRTARQPALFAATRLGHAHIVELFLSREDTDVNSVSRENRTAISLASHGGYENIVRLLLGRSDIDVEKQDWRGSTPLFLAVRNRHKNIVRLLLERNPTVINKQNIDGDTCLIRAVRDGDFGLVQSLLDLNADVSLKDQSNRTALDWARYDSRKRIENLLLRHTGEKKPPPKRNPPKGRKGGQASRRKIKR